MRTVKIDINSNNIYTINDVFENIINAQKLYLNGNFSEAYDLIVPACKNFDFFVSIGLKGPNLNKNQYQAVYMLAGDICGELGKFDEALSYYKKHQFFSLQINNDFQDCDTITLYQFRNTKRYTLDNLSKNQITLVDPRVQNDIVDSPIFAWLDTLCGRNAKYKKHVQAFRKSFDYLRATSFCSDSEDSKAIENTLMWAHYANCHKGICVQYELGKKDFTTNQTEYATVTRLMRIKYTNPSIESEVLNFADPETKLNARIAFASKSIDWQYEHEVRMIAYVPTHTSKYVQYTFETPNPIKAIYFGVKCSTQRKNQIRQIFANFPDVKFYQMKINPSNIHRLLYDLC